MRRETACFSMYSDISILMMFFSVSKRNSARALASSVFPTPVGPRNMKTPMGFSGSAKPDLERRMAPETLPMAWSWPTTRLWRWVSISRSFSESDLMSFETGIPVHLATISAMSSSSTSSFNICLSTWSSASSFWVALSFVSSSGMVLNRSSETFS